MSRGDLTTEAYKSFFHLYTQFYQPEYGGLLAGWLTLSESQTMNEPRTLIIGCICRNAVNVSDLLGIIFSTALL